MTTNSCMVCGREQALHQVWLITPDGLVCDRCRNVDFVEDQVDEKLDEIRLLQACLAVNRMDMSPMLLELDRLHLVFSTLKTFV